jgi:hypothetical protein
LLALVSILFAPAVLATVISAPFGTSYQVNVNAAGQNIPGDAANEPSLCIDPNNPNRIAIGWRQFDTTNSNFRQAGYGSSANGGMSWTFGGVLQTNVFRSDPVLATDAEGRFYYLSLNNPNTFACDIWRSTNGGASWVLVGPAVGGDKSWMTIDTTPSPGHGTIYQAWQTVSPTGTRDFSLSYDGGVTWTNPFVIPQTPIFGTLDVGPQGQVYLIGTSGGQFWLNRSTNATNHAASFNFDLTVPVNLAGQLLFGGVPSPGGLLGQAWVAVDRSTTATRGNVYALCSTGNASNQCDVVFARSTNGGATWSAPVRINTDPGTNAFHWFGTISVAPNGRVDVCWYDTRSNTNNLFSELYYSYSVNGGVTWSPNTPVSPAFDSSIGYPQQSKIGDYIGMISFDDAVCIAYSATFNGEEDIYFLRMPDLPIRLTIANAGANVALSWNAIVGNTYCLQYKSSLTAPWPVGSNSVCLVATNSQMTLTDSILAGGAQRFYRVVLQSYAPSMPVIVSQPGPASVTNYAGLAASFSINAYSSPPLYYQWKHDGVPIPGATQNSLSLRPLASSDAGTYLVTLSNANGTLNSSSVTVTVLPPPTNPPNISGLVLHLPFDNNLTDSTGRGNNGTAIHTTSSSSNVASATFVSGMLGSAFHYASDFGAPSTTDYATLGLRPDLQFGSTTNFTVAYWIKLPINYARGDLPIFTDAANSTFNAGFCFAPTYGTQAGGSTDGGWSLSLFNGSTGSAGIGVYGDARSINDGAWHHLVHTFDRVNGMVTYLDGVVAHYAIVGGSSVAAAGNINNGRPAVIGQDPTGRYPETGSGDIDDLGVWQKVLTPLEAGSIYIAAVSNQFSFTGSGPALSLSQSVQTREAINKVSVNEMLYSTNSPKRRLNLAH